ncbi:MAG: hypothetical protein ABII99_03990, partial [Patescibacteria group bacterium]
GRHPVVEHVLAEPFIANDLYLFHDICIPHGQNKYLLSLIIKLFGQAFSLFPGSLLSCRYCFFLET